VGGGGVAPGGAGGPAACLEKLGKKVLAAGWAVAVQANMIWLVSGPTKIVEWPHQLLATPDQMWNNEIPCQTTIWKGNPGDANDQRIFAA
jgi:hypothetical protein